MDIPKDVWEAVTMKEGTSIPEDKQNFISETIDAQPTELEKEQPVVLVNDQTVQSDQKKPTLCVFSKDELEPNKDGFETTEKKCLIILALSTIGKLEEQEYKLGIKPTEVIEDNTSSDGKDSQKEPFYGAYQLESVSNYIISRQPKQIKHIEFLVLATTATQEEQKAAVITSKKDGSKKEYVITKDEGNCLPTASNLFRMRILEHVREHYPQVQLRFVEKHISENVRQEMPDLLDQVRKEVGADDEVYIDVHGGPRATQQLLLNLLSILGEEGIHIRPDHILTADGYATDWTIKTAGEGFRINDFVAGIHEFVNYGRIDSLNNFYDELKKSDPAGWENEMSPVAKNLIDTMKNVSSAIQLCDMAWFDRLLSDKTLTGEPNLEGLPLRLAAFKNSDSKSSYLGAFLNLIESGYGQLLKWSKDKKCYDISNDAISEIEWCLDRGLYQQMLTICESEIPEYLFKKGVIRYEERIVNKGNEKKGDYELYNFLFNNIVNNTYRDAPKDDREHQERFYREFNSLEVLYVLERNRSDDLRSFLEMHNELKKIRNHSNHSSKVPLEMSEQDLKDLVDKYIKVIKSLVKQCSPKPKLQDEEQQGEQQQDEQEQSCIHVVIDAVFAEMEKCADTLINHPISQVPDITNPRLLQLHKALRRASSRPTAEERSQALTETEARNLLILIHRKRKQNQKDKRPDEEFLVKICMSDSNGNNGKKFWEKAGAALEECKTKPDVLNLLRTDLNGDLLPIEMPQ